MQKAVVILQIFALKNYKITEVSRLQKLKSTKVDNKIHDFSLFKSFLS